MRRVGVITDNATLVVGLSLQAHDLDVTRVADPSQLGAFDVALIDAVEEGPAAFALPPGPVVVLVTNGNAETPGTVAVRRPYTLAELIHTLQTVHHPPEPALPEQEPEAGPQPEPEPEPEVRQPETLHVDAVAVAAPLVVLAEDPEPESEAEQLPVLLATPEPLSEEHPPPPTPAPPRPRPEPASRSDRDPIAKAVHDATELHRLVLEAPFLRSAGRLANGICRVLSGDLGADHVALWQRSGQVFELVGSYGLSDADMRLRPHHRHPMLQQVAASGGVVVDNADAGGALMLGMPGSRSTTFAAGPLDLSEVRADLVTVGGTTLPTNVLDRIEAFLAETTDGWRAATAVEDLLADLTD